MLINPTTESIFIALKSFIVSVLAISPDKVIKGLGNGVPAPTGAYVCMTELRQRALSTNVSTVDATAQTRTVLRPTEFDIQVDCYGPLSGDWAALLTTMLRDQYGCDSFAASLPGSAPLYCTDPRQAPLVTGEENYQRRMLFSALIQYNPVITVPQQSAVEVDVTPVNVNTTFSLNEVN